MMMAQSSTPPPPHQLSDATVDLLRSALTSYIRSSNGSAEGLKPALLAVAAEARQAGMYPERLLILLKDIWFTLPAVRAMDDIDRRNRLLQQLVTACIREYYGD
jgi:hypothetical protein